MYIAELNLGGFIREWEIEEKLPEIWMTLLSPFDPGSESNASGIRVSFRFVRQISPHRLQYEWTGKWRQPPEIFYGNARDSLALMRA